MQIRQVYSPLDSWSSLLPPPPPPPPPSDDSDSQSGSEDEGGGTEDPLAAMKEKLTELNTCKHAPKFELTNHI